ncbi:hypothetical protein [Nonomuraea sp. NPDC050310]|uniref:hypothetical protein n=1 Tax=Nonomuraea sp. NPDC050310 TaxID=3154935 RepID=UPI0033D6C701
MIGALLAGCQAAPTPSTTAQSSAAATTPAPATAVASVEPDRVIVERKFTLEESEIKAEVVQFRRRDRFVQLSFRLTAIHGSGAIGWSVHNNFSAVPNDQPTIDGVYLIDTKNAKKHLTAVDSEGRCVCSSTRAVYLRTGDTITLSATFTAPPPDITAMTVHIPLVGTLSDVPLS